MRDIEYQIIDPKDELDPEGWRTAPHLHGVFYSLAVPFAEALVDDSLRNLEQTFNEGSRVLVAMRDEVRLRHYSVKYVLKPSFETLTALRVEFVVQSDVLKKPLERVLWVPSEGDGLDEAVHEELNKDYNLSKMVSAAVDGGAGTAADFFVTIKEGGDVAHEIHARIYRNHGSDGWHVGWAP